MNSWMLWLTAISTFLVIYHHLGYPLLLKMLARSMPSSQAPTPMARGYNSSESDHKLPTVAILMPAFNEEQWIADKIRNLATLDYPNDKLRIVLACDGCSDNTATIARETINETACQHLDLTVIEYAVNEGKVAVINKSMSLIDEDIVAMSDISSLISIDALLIAAMHFSDPKVGVVNSRYHLLKPTEGEKKYWDYQCALQHREAKMGATLGAHGAFYLMRRELFTPLAADTINDDFMLPMSVVAQGYRGTVDDTICAVELEPTNVNQDFKRRLRIGAGNYQQMVRLVALLNPKYRGVAFTFASGKALRVIMPFLMLTALFGWLWLAQFDVLFLIGAVAQVTVYALVVFIKLFKITPTNSMIATLCYLVSGHTANMIGTLRYIIGLEAGRWQRV